MRDVPLKSQKVRSVSEKQLFESAIAAGGRAVDWFFWQDRRRRAEAIAHEKNKARLMLNRTLSPATPPVKENTPCRCWLNLPQLAYAKVESVIVKYSFVPGVT